MTWEKYIRKNVAEMRPYKKGETLDKKVSISKADKDNGSPKVGDMIARNPKNHNDQWLVAKDYFKENFKKMDKKNKLVEDKIPGGVADDLSVEDIAKKHNVSVDLIKSQLKKGIKVELEHTDDSDLAEEIAMDHLYEIPTYYDGLKKMEKEMEAKEQTMSSGSGSYAAPMGSSPIKKPISKIHNSEMTESDPPPKRQDDPPGLFGKLAKIKKGEYKEATTSAVSANGQYDAPFGTGKKNPLKIDGPDSIKNSKAVKDPKFPMWVKGGSFVDVKKKCRLGGNGDGTSAQCNQGDINSLNIYKPRKANESFKMLNETIKEVAKEYGLPIKEVKKIVLKEIG